MTATYPTKLPPPPGDTAEPAAPVELVEPSHVVQPGRARRMLARVPKWVGPVAVGGLALTSCVYVRMVDPSTTPSAFYPVCTFKMVTGLDCPGCGLTRAMHELMNGHPLMAADHNIFILAIFPLAAYMYIRWLTRTTVGHELPRIRVPLKLTYALAPMVIGFWILRNIPWGPFHWLAATAG